MKYVIYLRVSTDEQKKSGLGLEAQKKACIDYINRQSNKDYVIFSDEGVSGGLRMDEREEMENAIASLNEGDVFIVSGRDRIGRDVIQNAIIEMEIEKKKSKLISVNQDDSLMDEGIARLMKTVIDAISQYERYQISKRTRVALAAKKARGERVGHIPYGYSLGENKQLVVNLCESETLKRMYALRMNSRFSYQQVANQLNLEGHRNRGDCFKRDIDIDNFKKDTPWTCGSVHRVYKNYLKVIETVRALQGRSA